jgi:hypothetical protein
MATNFNYISPQLTILFLGFFLFQELNKKLELQKKRRCKDPRLAVPKPNIKDVRSGVLKTKTVRSLEKRREMELKKARVLAGKFKKFAQVIRVPFTLESLNETFTKKEKAKLEAICDKELGPQQESQCLSAQFVDKDGQPILFYFGERLIRDGEDPPVKHMFCIF